MDIEEYLPYLREGEAEAARDAVESGWISPAGEKVEEFERKAAERLDVDHAVAVDSGTAALHLALECLELPDGSEVVVQDFTYGSTGLAVKQAGLEPVIADVEPETLSLDPDQLEEAVNGRTEAVVVAHIAGRPARMDSVMEVADRHDLAVVEDAALAFGASHRGRKTGTIGDIGCFSFAWNKNITTGKGGMVVTSGDSRAGMLEQLADYGRSRDDRFEFVRTGYNYDMDSIRAGIGLKQLERFDKVLERKRDIFNLYRHELEELDLELHRPDRRDHVEEVPSTFHIMTDRRDELQEHLESEGIGSRRLFEPLSSMEAFPSGSYPVSEEVASRALGLPSHPGLSGEEVRKVCFTVREFFR